MRHPNTWTPITLTALIALLSTPTAALAEDCLAPQTWYADGDRDGFGERLAAVVACAPPAGFVARAGDCDDTTAATHPDAAEVCDGVDNDCDGVIDASGPPLHPYGAGGYRVITAPTADPGDIRWSAPDFRDGAWAIAEGPLGSGAPWCLQTGQGWPSGHRALVRHTRDLGRAAGDVLIELTVAGTIEGIWLNGVPISGPREQRVCSDVNTHPLRIDRRLLNPTGEDVLAVHLTSDGGVTYYDHRISASLTRTHFADLDNDGVGDPTRAASVCAGSPGWVDDDTDCDDHNARIHPGAEEICDDLDNDCDGVTDDFEQTCQVSCGESVRSCRQGVWGVCSAPARVAELCDGLDNDCDGEIDETPEACGASEACWCEQARCETAADCDDPTHTCVDGLCVGDDGPGCACWDV